MVLLMNYTKCNMLGFHWSAPGNVWSLQLTINWRNQWSMWEDKTMRRDCGQTISVLLCYCWSHNKPNYSVPRPLFRFNLQYLQFWSSDSPKNTNKKREEMLRVKNSFTFKLSDLNKRHEFKVFILFQWLDKRKITIQ